MNSINWAEGKKRMDNVYNDIKLEIFVKYEFIKMLEWR